MAQGIHQDVLEQAHAWCMLTVGSVFNIVIAGSECPVSAPVETIRHLEMAWMLWRWQEDCVATTAASVTPAGWLQTLSRDARCISHLGVPMGGASAGYGSDHASHYLIRIPTRRRRKILVVMHHILPAVSCGRGERREKGGAPVMETAQQGGPPNHHDSIQACRILSLGAKLQPQWSANRVTPVQPQNTANISDPFQPLNAVNCANYVYSYIPRLLKALQMPGRIVDKEKNKQARLRAKRKRSGSDSSWMLLSNGYLR